MKKKPTYALEYTQFEFLADYPIIALTGDMWTLPDDEITFLHCHNCMEIGYCHQGSGTLVVEGKSERFQVHDITMICPNTMHKSKSDKGTTSDWEYVYVDTNRLVKEYFPDRFPDIACLSFDSPDFRNVLHGSKDSEMDCLMRLLLTELREKDANYQLKAACLCTSLLLSVIRRQPREFCGTYSGLNTKLAIYAAVEFVEENYMNPIQISDLAAACNLSLTHFRRLFCGIMHESPLNYVDRTRVNKSCKILYSTEDTILDIALQVGFSSSNSFNRNFKKFRGMTPLQWKNEFRAVKKKNMEFLSFNPSSIEGPADLPKKYRPQQQRVL